ncbi:MAG: hypothetical protein D6748_04455 [Calditrichaeota bacterium]|nr:MAG: hypothetical protein D6748_04455 [Calditrichota bacterium]
MMLPQVNSSGLTIYTTLSYLRKRTFLFANFNFIWLIRILEKLPIKTTPREVKKYYARTKMPTNSNDLKQEFPF